MNDSGNAGAVEKAAGREVTDRGGRAWVAIPVASKVAHLRDGAALGFRPAEEADAEPILTNVEFNSFAAAELAIGTMSEKEISRRLQWAKTDAGIH